MTLFSMRTAPRRWVTGAALLAGLSACSNASAPLPATQVAAKVGSEEISLHQVNAVLSQDGRPGATPEQVQARSRAVLEGLIDQQLAIEQALAAKLNRSPEVVAQIEAARRDILARAYIKQWVASLPGPDAQAVQTYYQTHPALFAERRVFSVQELVLARTPEVLAQLNRMAAANQSMDEVAAWLKTNKIAFTPASANRAAEQIPLDLLPRMQALQDGQDAVFTSGNAITFVRLVASQRVPISERDAQPGIAVFLRHQQSADSIAQQLKRLRSQSTVSYQGEFAVPAVVAVPVAGAAALQDTAAASDGSTGSADTRLEKGVAGLK